MTRRILQILLPLIVLIGGAFGAKSLIDSFEAPVAQPPVIEPPFVRALTAEEQDIRLYVTAEGTVRPRAESELVPEVAGRVTWVSSSLAIGGFFETGDELLKIDPREYELAVTQSRAAVAQAQLRVAMEQQEASVARKEWDDLGRGEPTSLVLREPQLAEARAALASAQAALEQTQFDLERTVVKAPFDGRIRRKQVDIGQYVQRGQSVATLYSTDVAEVKLPIPDKELEFLRLPLAYRDSEAATKGPSVAITADFAGQTYSWQGRIVRTEGELDPQTRMIQALAHIENPYEQRGNANRPPLAVGMFVQAEITGRTVRAIALPRTALRGESVAWVINDRNQIEFRQLDILRLERDRVLVRGGIESGERVCVSTLEAAVQGMEVRVLDADPAAASD